MNLEGKTILVTGSSLGIGRETASQFARERCRVMKHGEAALYQLDIRTYG